VRVAQVSFFADPRGRDPDVVLADWPDLLELALGAAIEGASVDLVIASRSDHPPFRRGDVRVHFVSDPTRMLPLRLVERVVSLRPEVVHVNGLSFPRQTLHLALRAPWARIVAQDHADRPLKGWRRHLQRAALARTSGVMFTSREQARPFLESGVLGSSLPVFEVLESACETAPGDREEARRVTGTCGDPSVLWVGNLDRNKDPLTMLEAIDLALAELPSIELSCCFKEAPLIDVVRARLRASPELERRVHLLGRKTRAELMFHQRAADFYVSASHRESTGYSALEALSSGTTPILTDIPSFRRITLGGQVGALVPMEDPRAMSRALIDLARQDRGALRAKARAHYEAELSAAVNRKRLISAYRAVLGTA
jgi:glycosyltransferase involved in cell wall biosynthesis